MFYSKCSRTDTKFGVLGGSYNRKVEAIQNVSSMNLSNVTKMFHLLDMIVCIVLSIE